MSDTGHLQNLSEWATRKRDWYEQRLQQDPGNGDLLICYDVYREVVGHINNPCPGPHCPKDHFELPG